MARWITRTDIEAIYTLNTGTPSAEIEKYIDHAQFVDLQPLLGRDLYHDIIQDEDATTNGSYPDLLDGSVFTFNDKTYTNPGVRIVHAYFALARYLFSSSYVDTGLGVGKFLPENMEKASDRKESELNSHYQKIGMAYWKDVEFFLNAVMNTDNEFAYWYCGRPRIPPRQQSLRIDSGAIG